MSTHRKLLDRALNARQNAYAPYSGYRVGAALLCPNGKIYTGCNVENASYSATICAERSAFAAAVSAGEREFTAIAVAGGKEESADEAASPCGICRQVMREFADPEQMRVIIAVSPTDYKEMTLEELLPESFEPSNLG